MCLADCFWKGKPCKKGHNYFLGCREGPRDEVVVERDVVRYLLWGNEIANWNRKRGILMVDDCGWQTKLTMDRLNAIMRRLGFSVYSDRREWCLHNLRTDETYVWEGTHTINLETRRVSPCTPKIRNEKVSESLRRFYEKAKELVERRKFLTVPTLDGRSYVFVNSSYKRISKQVLYLHISEYGFEAYKGMVAASKVYSAFVKYDVLPIIKDLTKHGWEIRDARKLLQELQTFGVNVNILPENIVSQLALAKLLEG